MTIIVVRKKQRIEIIESDSEDEVVPVNNSGWTDIAESDIPLQNINITTGNKVPGQQIFNIDEPIKFFKLYFADDLVDEIITEMNSYAKNKFRNKTLCKNSIWHMWHDTNKKNSGPFLESSLIWAQCICQMCRTIGQPTITLKYHFFSNVFTRRQFNQIFWMLHLKTIDLQSRHVFNKSVIF